MMKLVGRVAGTVRAVAGLMRGSIGDHNHDTLRFRPKRERRGVRQCIELILGNIAAAARVQRSHPAGELLDVRRHRVAILAIAVRILRDNVIFEGHQPQPVIAIVRRQLLRELDNVLLDRVDIRLHRLRHVQHEHDIDRTPLADAAKIQNLRQLPVLIHLDVFHAQIAHGLPARFGHAEIELHAAVGVEMLQPRISDRDLRGRPRRRRRDCAHQRDQSH